jgi:galactokinase
LPVAIDRSVLVAASARDDRRVVFEALDLGASSEFSLDALKPSSDQPWSNYQRGVAHFLQEQGHRLRGMNAALTSDVPIGAGLSSSAAVEVATAFALSVLNELDISLPDLALVGQRAEHEFVGLPCGIMDQFVSALGRRGHALLLDCRSLHYELVHLPPGLRIVVCDSGVRRELATSEYRVRRAQCEEAVRLLQSVLPDIRALRDVTLEQLSEHSGLLPEVVFRRARHVVGATERMGVAVSALRRDDAEGFGQAVTACHVSQRDDYEISCTEIEALVDAASHVEGCYGSRLTGGGFGGSTVNLVADDAVSDFEERVVRRYRQQTGRDARVFVCTAESGVGVVEFSE